MRLLTVLLPLLWLAGCDEGAAKTADTGGSGGSTDGTEGGDGTDGTEGGDGTDGTEGGDGTDGSEGGDGTDGSDGGARDCGPPDASPEPSRSGHPTDGWRWDKQGPLFEDTAELGYTEGDLAPALVATEAGLHLLFLRDTDAETGLYASTSADGVDWSAPVPVTGLDGGGHDYPSLLHIDGVFHLFAGSGSVRHATSTDGVAFSPGETVLRAGTGGDWDSLSLLYPRAVAEGDEVVLYYTGFSGVAYAIGHTPAAAPGTLYETASLLLERDPEGWDNAAVGMPQPVRRDGALHLFYGGYDEIIADPGPWRVGQLDPESGERRVSLELAEAGVDAWSTRDPAIVPWGDGYLMVYVGMGDDGVYRLLRASSDVCN